MNMLNLKIIAIITMTIDHLGVFIFPGHIIFRIIGRLSFIIFAFLIANGFKYTRNIENYCIRLLAMAFICQIPDMLLKVNYPGNIFFGLTLGLMSINLLNQKNIKASIGYILILLLSIILNIDYGIYGILMINFFYLIEEQNILKVIQVILFLIIQTFGIFILKFAYITYFSIISLPIIWQYNGEKGYSSKWLNNLFYLYYPVHLIIIIGISFLIS